MKNVSSYVWLLVLVAFFVVFYFMAIRPQSKQRKAHQEMMNSLAKGDYVMTASGIYGKVIKADDTLVVIEIAKGVNMKVVRRAIADIIKDKDRIKSIAPEGTSLSSAKNSRGAKSEAVGMAEGHGSDSEESGEES